jgi:ABC-2 type transport system permease protein
MAKWWLVAKREFLYNLRRRSFLFAAFGAPLFTIVIMFVAFAAVDASLGGEFTGTIGYVDQAGVLDGAFARPDNFAPYSSVEAAAADLEAGALSGYFVIAPDYLNTGEVTLYRGGDVPPSVEDEIDAFLVANLSSQIGDPQLAELVQDPVDLAVRPLDTGRTIRDDGIIGVFLAPFIFMMVFLIGSQTTSTYLMSGVAEEKTNRIMEILVTSVTPFQLLAGKIIGLGALGLMQLGIWLGAGALVLALNRDGTIGFLAGVHFPLDLVLLSLVYFVLFYFLFSSIMAGIGAVTGSEQESRQIAGLFGFIVAIPFFFIFTFFEDPNGTIPVFLTLFPLTSPMVVILRASFAAIPAWQIALSVGLLLLTSLLVAWASARIFRWSLLMYGKRPSFRMLLQALRPGARMQTTATGEAAG